LNPDGHSAVGAELNERLLNAVAGGHDVGFYQSDEGGRREKRTESAP